MTFIEALADIGEAGAADYTRSQMGSLVNLGLDEGASANSMYSQFQAAGIGVRRQDFLGLVRQVNDARAMTDQ